MYVSLFSMNYIPILQYGEKKNGWRQVALSKTKNTSEWIKQSCGKKIKYTHHSKNILILATRNQYT